PDGLRGTDIPLSARIVSVADAFDAMTSDRPYRHALSFETAQREIREGAGGQFDPAVVDAWLSIPESRLASLGRPGAAGRAAIFRLLTAASHPVGAPASLGPSGPDPRCPLPHRGSRQTKGTGPIGLTLDSRQPPDPPRAFLFLLWLLLPSQGETERPRSPVRPHPPLPRTDERGEHTEVPA